jgi:hypothetical protein
MVSCLPGTGRTEKEPCPMVELGLKGEGHEMRLRLKNRHARWYELSWRTMGLGALLGRLVVIRLKGNGK